MRPTLLLIVLMLLVTGCTTSQPAPAYNAAQHSGALAENSVGLTNQLMNMEFQQRMLGAYAENAHRQALDTYGSQARDQISGNASETAMRGYQGTLNALASGSDVREAGRTVDEVLSAQTKAISDLGSVLKDLRGEIDELKVASGN